MTALNDPNLSFIPFFGALLLEKRTFKRLFLYVWFCTDLAPLGRYRHDLRPREISKCARTGAHSPQELFV